MSLIIKIGECFVIDVFDADANGCVEHLDQNGLHAVVLDRLLDLDLSLLVNGRFTGSPAIPIVQLVSSFGFEWSGELTLARAAEDRGATDFGGIVQRRCFLLLDMGRDVHCFDWLEFTQAVRFVACWRTF